MKRKAYDRAKREDNKAPDIDAEKMYKEEFHENAFGLDSESETDEDSDKESDKHEPLGKPNQEHQKIYESATPFMQDLILRPPATDVENKAVIEKAKAFNDQIKEQNIKDGLKDDEVTRFYIQYTIFSSTALLMKPYLERLEKDRNDTEAQQWVTHHDSVLEKAVRENGYPKSWSLKGMNKGFGKDNGFEKDKRKPRSGPDNGTKKDWGKPRSGPDKGTEKDWRKPRSGPDNRTKKDRRKPRSGSDTENDKPNSGAGNGGGSTVAAWKPGYTLHGEKILAHIPKERAIRRMVDGVRKPAEKIVFGYQFIILNELEEILALVPGQEVGEKAQSGYFSLPEDQRLDARYSEDRYTIDDAETFDKLIDFASNPFRTRSSDRLTHPPGYGLVQFKDGAVDILSRTALRNMLGATDADWEIQECDKRHDRIPAYLIEPEGWREPKSKMIEAPSRRYLQRRDPKYLGGRVIGEDSRRYPRGRKLKYTRYEPSDSGSESESLFVSQKSSHRSASIVGGASSAGGASTSSIAAEMTAMREQFKQMQSLLQQLVLSNDKNKKKKRGSRH